MTSLEKLYREINGMIGEVDFGRLCGGFKPLKFALYDDESCFFDGGYIEKTDDFLANTSIEFRGGQIAIWNVSDDIDPEILVSKLIHEMFHGYQRICGESRYPNELSALINYRYSPELLAVKAAENALLVSLDRDFDESGFQRLLGYKKYRQSRFPGEFSYDAAVEQIEGSAGYIELEALRQISPDKYAASLQAAYDRVRRTENLIPARIIAYDTGALFIRLLLGHTDVDFGAFSDTPFAAAAIKDVHEAAPIPQPGPELSDMASDYAARTDRIISEALTRGKCVAKGDFELLGVNVYDARYGGGYIVSRCFVAYSDGGQVVRHGDFVIRIDEDYRVREIYRLG